MGLGGVEALGEEAGGGHLSNPSVLVISLNLSKRDRSILFQPLQSSCRSGMLKYSSPIAVY